IACVIHLEPAWHANDIPRRLPAVVPHSVIVDRVRMKCVRHGEFKLTDCLRAALAHRASLLSKAFALNPQTCLEYCRNFRFELLGYGQKIAQVIGMRMSQENRV